MAPRSARSPRSLRSLRPSSIVRRVTQSYNRNETSWLQETQEMYRAHADSPDQDSDEMLLLLLNATLICGVGMLMHALCG